MPITSSTTITTVGYNDIQSKISRVLGTDYGYPGVRSIPVTSGTTITSRQWRDLYTDINRCLVHQTGVKLSPEIIGTYNTVSNRYENVLITAATAAAFDSYAAQCLANSTAVDESQLSANSVNGVSTVTSAWGNNRRHQVTHTWPTAKYASYFFNLGGNIKVILSYTSADYSGQDAVWRDLIDAVNTRSSTQGYGPSDFITGFPVTITESSGNSSITVNFSKVSSTQTLTEVILLNPDATASDIDITSTVEYQYSVMLDPALPTGGGCPTPALPQTDKILGLDNTNNAGFTITKILSIDPTPIVISMPSGTTSTSLITLTNLGNSGMEIGTINASTPAGLGMFVSFYEKSWGATVPLILAPNQFATIVLSYSNALRQGAFNARLTVVADNDIGLIVTPVNITVTEPVFDFTFLPAAISKPATNGSLVSQVFSYVTTGAYSVDSSADNPALFQDFNYFTMTVNPAAKQITLVFNPQVRKINGTYSAYVSLTLVGNRRITKSISFTVTRNIDDQSSNLGVWISAKAAFNSVVGMSYDIIEGGRYLTIGVGAQGVQTDTVLSSGLTPVTVENLGVTADDRYANGTVLYAGISDPLYCQFLTDYGSWVRPNSYDPLNISLSRSYKFTVPKTSRYSWEFSADNQGSFSIDNGPQLNATSNFSTSERGTVGLGAGQHVIKFRILNAGGPGNIAIVLTAADGTQIWSTRDPVRLADPYPNWGEVYRIPLPGAASVKPVTYQSAAYCIKDTAAARPLDGNESAQFSRWGDFFGTPSGATSKSLFTVVYDGFGGLAITMNGKTGTAINASNETTSSNLPYSSYYYSTRGVRYTQLESTPINANGNPDSGSIYTHQFTGFNLYGQVTNIITEYPIPDLEPVAYVPTSNDSGGGYDGFGNNDSGLGPGENANAADAVNGSDSQSDTAAANGLGGPGGTDSVGGGIGGGTNNSAGGSNNDGSDGSGNASA